MIRLDVLNSRELQATLLAIRSAPKEVRKNIRQFSKSLLAPEWQKGLTERAETRVQQRVLAQTAKVTVSDQNVKLRSGGGAKRLSSGTPLTSLTQAAEFGVGPAKQLTYSRKSRNGGTHRVKRRIGNLFRRPNRKGYVVYPTAGNLIPRFAALWVQTTVRTFYEALERK